MYNVLITTYSKAVQGVAVATSIAVFQTRRGAVEAVQAINNSNSNGLSLCTRHAELITQEHV